MLFTQSRLVLAGMLLTSGLILSACSKQDQNAASDTLTANTPATGEASTLSERNAQQRFMRTLEQQFKKADINAKITAIKATEVPNIYWVSLEGMGSVYATRDGKYILQGDIVRLGDKQLVNVGDSLQASENKKLFAALDPKDLIIYQSNKAQPDHVIYVFTDSSCPYCHRLHEHLGEITSKGVEVRYIAWPRGEQFMPTMQAIWCSEDRKAAFAQSVRGEEVTAPQCNNPVAAQYQLGQSIGVNGTPAIYDANGHYLGGYLSPEELLKRLSN